MQYLIKIVALEYEGGGISLSH